MMVKRRNLFLQILLTVITCGLYSVYWYYATTREILQLLKREDDNVFLWTVLFLVPPLFCYSYYKQGEAYEQLTGGELNRWVTFILWVVFAPIVWVIVQRKLNSVADAQMAIAASRAQQAQLNA